jgi:hypothetical protein
MNVYLELEDIQPRYIHISNPVKNTVLDNSMFMRISYSNNLCSMNCIHIHLNLNAVRVFKYFNRYTYEFNYEDNLNNIETLSKLEHYILDSLNINNLQKTIRLKPQFIHNKIHIHTQSSCIYPNTPLLILKISGVWLSSTHYGLTYKFIHGLTHPLKNILK